MTVWEAIRAKHSVRDFTDEALPEDVIQQIIEAGRRSPSGFNSQPWQFIVVTERDKLEALSKIGRSTRHVAGAAMCLVILSPPEDENFWRNMFDVGQAAAFMQLTAQELGVGSCPASVYWPEIAREILGFPDDWDLRVVISFGYPDHNIKPPAPARKGGRKPLEEVAHWNGW